MKAFAQWTVKATAILTTLAVLNKFMSWFEHKMLDGVEPLHRV